LGVNKALYEPRLDFVLIPPPERFERRADYYAVLFHELAHSTGHERRLNRALPDQSERLKYCLEDLIAEMAAAYLCGRAGLLDQTLDNSAAYIDGWLKALRRDRRLVFTAAAQAQKAADYILGRGRGPRCSIDGKQAGG
jgi:antirestriction protein ArdC